ncbi:hypothetical protein FE257_000052 [Aspergillus nanangensis]|uniref:Uncharacterized protein n=1 Tax=Aspergillus nanangensis TaxID=2582783 RepID=A0AAD4GZV5_ASPNN|nr:hypothetical protein FE257_000052 [Aspergillus nanangensis]
MNLGRMLGGNGGRRTCLAPAGPALRAQAVHGKSQLALGLIIGTCVTPVVEIRLELVELPPGLMVYSACCFLVTQKHSALPSPHGPFADSIQGVSSNTWS